MVYLPHWPTPKRIFLDKSDPAQELAVIKVILRRLNYPENNLPPVIHLAGTNGKGSTTAFLASIFQAANYQTHIYTSPHLHHCNERIVISNHQISDEYLYEILEEVRIASGDLNLTLFGGMTIAAILAFSKNPADVCIIETGMGGRVDPTNILDKKILTILTSISYDHTEFLGNDIRAIAAEKSHIMRSGIPCVLAPQCREAKEIIKLRSIEIANPIINFDQDFQIEINQDDSFDFTYSGPNFSWSLKNIEKPGLEGEHQYLNASLAIAGICTIKDFATGQFRLSKQNINDGIRKVKWPSRLEKINNNLNKLLNHSNSEIWIDGAHNVGGAYVVSNWLKEKIIDDLEFDDQPKRNYLIVGFTKNKAKPEFFRPFIDIIDFICPIRVDGEPNPEDAEIIAEKINLITINNQPQDDLAEAIRFLDNLDQHSPCRIIICGSLYLAQDVKKFNSYPNFKG